MSRALEGIRVVELGDERAVLGGRILADLGAEVILVEPPGGGSNRDVAPFLEDEHHPEKSFAHLYFNANKHSVVLDLAFEADRQTFVDLIATTDVLLDTQAPGRLDRLELGHARLRDVNPGLVQCSVTPFGLNSPLKDWRANDLVAGAAGGLIQVSGSPQGIPSQGGADPSYTMAGLAAASAVMIALHQRDFGNGEGSGTHIDLSLQEATALSVMQTQNPSQWQWHKKLPRRPGLSAAMPCKDGKFVGLLVRPDRFEQFLAWADEVGIDHGMTMKDWHWARLESPRQGNPVAETTVRLSQALTRDEFVSGALKADIICLPVLDFPDLEQEEQYIVNDQFLALEHDQLGTTLGFVRSPVDAMADGVSLRRAPTLGEHQALLDQLPSAQSHNTDAQSKHPQGALAGLTVLDFSWVLAGPIGTRILASFGADVIRVESSTKPDSMRSQIGPDGKPHPDMGGLFNVVNAGKKSLAVDLTTSQGMEIIKRLVAKADVVVNNFRPGAMERMGLGYEVLKDIQPDVVLLNLPGAHRNGPWAQRPSMGNILMAASGFNMLTGFDGERPRGIGIAYPDFTSPHLLVATVLAALRQRRRSGQGQQLHLTQLSAVLSLLGAHWMQYKATGIQPPRNANRNPNYAPHGIYPTLDETDPETDAWIAIAIRGDEEFARLTAAMGRPDLAQDPAYATHGQRKANEDALDEMVRDWTQTHEKWALAGKLQAAGIAAAPVEHLKDMLEVDPQLSDHYQTINQPVQPEVNVPVDREAARWVGHELWLKRSPGIGEHNQYVIQELLDYDDEAFANLMIAGVLE
ncbi:MAG: CoA transferase [Pseudomonadota bacterium]